MSIKIISALSSNRVIGNDGKIPWFIKGELKRFKELTLNHNVVMGRKTFDSIGKTLEPVSYTHLTLPTTPVV